MKALRGVAGWGLQRRRTKWWKREFALRCGDEAPAMLYMEKNTGKVLSYNVYLRQGSIWTNRP